MKKLTCLMMMPVIASISLQIAEAQTNTFPATGNVGIGTASPASKLDITPATGNALTIRPYGTAAGNTGQLQFKELAANGNHHIAFKAPDAIGSNYVFRWPVNYGTNGQMLTTNGAGVLSWTTPSGGSGGSGWSLTGNSITASSFLGSTNAQALRFRMNNQQSGIIDLNNTALGYQTLLVNTGPNNTAIGTLSMQANTGGFANTAIGNNSLYSNTSGGRNTALGYDALRNNTTGENNTASGIFALSDNQGGHYNTASGYQALNSSYGSYNTAVGSYALDGNSTSERNTAVGHAAGLNGPGWNNVFVGAGAYGGFGNYNMVAIGESTTVPSSSSARIGNTATISIGGYAYWTNFSDGRYKKDVKENVKGLDFIMKLRPITYRLDVTNLSEKLGENREGGDNIYRQKAIEEKEKITWTGFIAQEVEQAAIQSGFDFSGVDKPRSENDFYGLRYGEFVVPLAKAVQELNKMNEELQKEIIQIKTVLTVDQQQRLSELQHSKPSLAQNIPNPFNKSTAIKYYLPEKFNDAQLKIYSSQGIEMKTFNIKQSGKGELTVEANTLVAGIYTYTLIVDGNAADVKQMIITK